MNKATQPTPLDLELLRGIRSLDRDGHNYLPIPAIRAALPAVSREALDRALTRLVGLGWIRLGLLQETRQVPVEQLEQGIPAADGRSIRFFVAVLPEAPTTEPIPEANPAPAAPPARAKGRRRLPAPPVGDTSPVRELRRALGLSQAELAELLGSTKLSVLRWEKELPTPRPLLLRAALEAHARGCLPLPEAGDGVWGWHARLFGALDEPRAL